MADTVIFNNPNLVYPLEDQSDYPGRIIFSAVEQDYRTLGEAVYDTVTTAETYQNLEDKDIVDAMKGGSFQRFKPRATNFHPKGSVSLYLPSQLQFGDQADYSNVDLGIIGAIAATGLRNRASGVDILSEMTKMSLPSIESIKDAAVNGLKEETAQIAALRLARRVSDRVAGAVETETGITINPNRRSTFQGIGIRRFNYNFSLVPTSSKEAEMIKVIIGFFRHHMYPEIEGVIDRGQGLSAAYKFPSKFKIKMLYGRNKVGTDILPCFLERVNVTYNPNAMAFHTDGNPQETQISLSFLEERALTKDDIRTDNRSGGFDFS